MKKLKHILTLVVAVFLTATNMNAQETKAVDTQESSINWKGYKVTGEHAGTISISRGKLDFDNASLKGGSFVIDMNSINVTDLQGAYKAKLEGHLKSDDFFGVANFPIANLMFTTVSKDGNTYTVSGDLTIKSHTEKITFDMVVSGDHATANLKIDRTKFDIKYGSASFFDGLKDKAIYDEFDVMVHLHF